MFQILDKVQQIQEWKEVECDKGVVLEVGEQKEI